MVTLHSNPYLVLRTESGDRYFSLVGGNVWTIGRSEDNNFVITDRWISRNHAMLQYMETGEFYLIDLGSRNGSFVNGRRVSIPVTLQNGDHLTFGQTEMDFYCPIDASTQTANPENESKEITATAMLAVRRLISVLVVDIRNFTGMTRQMDEKILSEMIGSWFRYAGDIIRQYGSWVDKYIGDAVMAVWIHGTKEVSQEEMVRILKAVNALHAMTTELSKQYPVPFPMRIGAGVNTGYAMVGNTGTGERPDYTALGDTVNAAFRLESSTKQIQMDVALGESTYQYAFKLIGANSSVFQGHQVELKGYDAPILTYACSFATLEEYLKQLP